MNILTNALIRSNYLFTGHSFASRIELSSNISIMDKGGPRQAVEARNGGRSPGGRDDGRAGGVGGGSRRQRDTEAQKQPFSRHTGKPMLYIKDVIDEKSQTP